MIGAPGESEEEINRTIKFAVISDLDEASFSITAPMPGTRLHDIMDKDERFMVSNDYSDFDYYRKLSYLGGDVSSKKLSYLQKKALFLFYIHPLRWRYILRHLLSARGILKFYYKIRRFF